MTEQFHKLFSPIKVGTMQLKNRICCLPHGLNFPEHAIVGLPLAMPGSKHAAYWEERARGGAGWIATQASVVSHKWPYNEQVYRG